MKFFNRHSRLTLPLLAILVIAGGLLYAPAAHAGWSDAVSIILGNLISLIITGLGAVLIVLMYILLWISQYNDFINSAAVSNGWTIVRDLCNMFFILILLVIAFATVLNQESYSLKKMLPKVLMMAVLINFSKLICGVILDFAQVVMLTFVNGFRDIGGGNLTHMLGINELLDLRPSENDQIELGSILGSYLLALMYVLVAIVVITVILFVLVMRMVMLWILIVLSPLPWLLQVLPSTKKYGDMWWKRFLDNVVAGPILAFFIWLSFASVTVTTTGSNLVSNLNPPNTTENENTRFATTAAPKAGLSTAGTPDGMLKFVISIGLLIGGLMVTKEMGGVIGSIAGKGFSAISSGAKTMSGYNAVADRISAFNKKRTAARDEKVAAFGERAFGGYLTAKKGAQGAVKSAYAGTKAGISSIGAATFERMKESPHPQAVGIVRGINAIKTWKANRQESKDISTEERASKREHKERLKEAYLTGVYKNENGDKFKEYIHTDAAGNTETRYHRKVVEKDDKGKIKKDAQGNVMYHYEDAEMTYRVPKKDVDGKTMKDPVTGKVMYEDKKETVTKMGAVQFKMATAWQSATVEAKAHNNKKEKERQVKEQEKMSDAGFSVGQLSAVLADTSNTNSKRLAAAMALAIKEGFKDRAHMRQAQGLLHDANNTLLTKKFEEDAKKKQAHLMYDLDTEGGRKKLGKDKIGGKFDVLQDGAYKDPRVIQALSDALSEKAYTAHMRKVKETGSAYDENQEKGQNEYLDKFQAPPLDPKSGNPHKSRKSVVELTGNLANGLRGITDTEQIKEVVKKLLQSMPKSQIAEQSPEAFKINTSIFKEVPQQDAYKDAVTEYYKTLDSLNGIQNARNAKQETIAAIKGIRGEDGASHTWETIQEDVIPE